MTPPDDRTLDELREQLAPLLPAEAAFDGWSLQALDAAARALDVPEDRARLAFDGDAVGMIDAWLASIDRALVGALSGEHLSALRIRERISALVLTRIELVAPHREALRRALSILALPTNAPRAAALAWRAADVMWRMAGDRATGAAHYSKRVTLAAVYGSTVLVLLGDESEGLAETRAFLARRIDGVMRIERVKAQLRPDPERQFRLTRFLGRLRYPAV